MATLKTLSYIQEMRQKFLEVSEPSSQEGSDLPRNPPINQNLKSKKQKSTRYADGGMAGRGTKSEMTLDRRL